MHVEITKVDDICVEEVRITLAEPDEEREEEEGGKQSKSKNDLAFFKVVFLLGKSRIPTQRAANFII